MRSLAISKCGLKYRKSRRFHKRNVTLGCNQMGVRVSVFRCQVRETQELNPGISSRESLLAITSLLKPLIGLAVLMWMAVVRHEGAQYRIRSDLDKGKS